MLFILLVKTHHFGWLKPIILATASPSPPWATRWQHGHQGYGPGPLLSFFFGFRTLRTTSCIYIYISNMCMYIYIYASMYILYILFLEHKMIMQLSDCLSEDPRLISPFSAILGTSIQKIRAIKPFQAFLRTSWNRRNHPRKVGGSSAKHGWHTNFAKRTESQWITYRSTTICNCMDELLPYFFGDLFMLLSVMFIFAGTVLLLGPWRRPKTKACRTWKMLRVIHRSLQIHLCMTMYIYISMYCEYICSNGDKSLCIYIYINIFIHMTYISCV